MFLLFLKNHTHSNMAEAICGDSGFHLTIDKENELLKKVCVVMDVIGFPLSTGFMV